MGQEVISKRKDRIVSGRSAPLRGRGRKVYADYFIWIRGMERAPVTDHLIGAYQRIPD